MPLLPPYPSLHELEDVCKARGGRLQWIQMQEQQDDRCKSVAAAVLQDVQNPKDLVDSEGNFSLRWLGDEGASALGPLLGSNSQLKHLDLSCNCIAAAGCTALFAGLGSNSTLTHIDLSANSVADEGAAAVAKALGGGTALGATVTSLDLHANSIGDEGAIALSAALPGCALVMVDLRANIIGDAGCLALAAELAEAPAIRLLNLHLNEASAEAFATVAAVVSQTGTPHSSVLHVFGVRPDMAPPLEDE